MIFLRPVGPTNVSAIASTQADLSAASNILICPPLFWPAQQSADSWQAVYRLAYEQLMLAFAPSPFQRALEPSLN